MPYYQNVKMPYYNIEAGKTQNADGQAWENSNNDIVEDGNIEGRGDVEVVTKCSTCSHMTRCRHWTLCQN